MLNFDNCVTCSSSSDNRITNPNNDKCDCLDKFYDNGISIKCESCHYSCFNCNSIKNIKK